MKFMNFSRKNAPAVVRLGCVFGDTCFDITKAVGDDLLEFPRLVFTIEEALQVKDGLLLLEEQLGGLKRASSGIHSYLFDSGDVTFHAPVARPQKIIGIGLNYKDHVEEIKANAPKQPLLFGMFASAILGPEQPIVIPEMSRQVDYEAELAVVIGRKARNVPAENAVEFVAGYTIFNDVSARDLQFADKQWLRAKSFDTFAPMGPYLVTKDGLDGADGLAIELRLNGQTMQKSNTENMIFKVPELVSYISKVMTLEAGDVILTGTPAGVGAAKVGDELVAGIDGLGELRVSIVAPR